MERTKEVRYNFSVIPHEEQRYETAGDWIPGKPTQLFVSALSNRNHEFLLMLHEFVEHELCKEHGISDRQVMAFDKEFEKEREAGLHSPTADAGNDSRAPYRDEHRVATRI